MKEMSGRSDAKCQNTEDEKLKGDSHFADTSSAGFFETVVPGVARADIGDVSINMNVQISAAFPDINQHKYI